MKVSFDVPGRPVAKQRARTVNGHTYTPPRTREYENLVAYCARMTGFRLSREREVMVALKVCSTRRLKGDIDNYAKSVLDGMVKGQLLADDDQITSLVVTKVHDADEDVVHVMVETL